MILEPSEIEKAAILAQILESPDFQDSRKHQELLAFLVERSSSADPLKEIEIALTVFGKDSKFDPTTDSLIRSYISILRKKLEHYYLTTGDSYAYKLEIPKGHYIVKFSPIVPKVSAKGSGAYLPMLKKGSWVVLVVLVLVLLFREWNARPPAASGILQKSVNPIWNEFVDPRGKPTMIVLGDYYFLRGRGSEITYFRTPAINTHEDYHKKILEDPSFGSKFGPNEFTFLRPSASWALFQIQPIFQNSQKQVSLKLASQFSIDDFKSNNVIFIGSFRSLFNLNAVLRFFNIEYTYKPSVLRITGRPRDSLVEFSRSGQRGGTFENDYAIVAKGVGPDGNAIMMLLGFADNGVIEAAHAASDTSLSQALSAKYPAMRNQMPSNFTLIIRTEGMTQTIFNSNIQYFGINKPLQTISDISQFDVNKMVR